MVCVGRAERRMREGTREKHRELGKRVRTSGIDRKRGGEERMGKHRVGARMCVKEKKRAVKVA